LVKSVNKENIFRYFIIFFTAGFSGFCLFDFLYGGVFSFGIFFVLAGLFIWIFFEAYIRIQHNVDARSWMLRTITEKAIADSQKNTELKIKREISESFFVIKNDLEFRLLNLRDEMKDSFNLLRSDSKEAHKNIALSFISLERNILRAEKELALLKKLQEDLLKQERDNLEKNLVGIKKTEKDINLIKEKSAYILRMAEILWIQSRKDALLRLAPDIFEQKSVLYIGASKERAQILEEFIKNRYNITILEAFKPNAEYWRSLGVANKVIEGDVRNFNSEEKFDVVFWWHGPEHIEKREFPPVLKNFERMANKVIVLACPWGEYKQGANYDNEFEIHHSAYYEGDFEKLGFKTSYLGKRDFVGSNICAVKYVN